MTIPGRLEFAIQIISHNVFSGERAPLMDSRSLATLLEHILINRKSLNIVQIGAFVGNTDNDPIFSFLHERLPKLENGHSCRAVLVEPVRHYYEELVKNYRVCVGDIRTQNVAIAESMDLRPFYRLRTGVDPVAHGFPAWTSQLGSLLKNRITDLFDTCEKDPIIRRFLEICTEVEYVITISYDQLLKMNNLNNVDFLQVDAEGYDYNIIRSINFKKNPPMVIHYEHALLSENIAVCRSLLKSQGYLIRSDGGDTLAVRLEYARALSMGFIEN